MSDMKWQKSSYSTDAEGSNCVELAHATGAVLLRESNEPEHVISTSPALLRNLLRAAKRGGLDAVGSH